MDRVFLDANILVSVAWKPVTRVLALWALTDIERLTSTYAITEAIRNVGTTERQARLFRAIQHVRIVDDASRVELPAGVRLAAKDAPILAAAIQAGASHLLTGDVTHFGSLYGRTVEGVQILKPNEYLVLRGL